VRYPAPAPDSWKRKLVRGAAGLLPSSLMVLHGARGKQRVSLTFDDGPDPMTRVYLDELDRLGVVATFFVLGARCREFKSELLEIIKRGHEVASHGFTHRVFPKLSPVELDAELRDTAAELPTPMRSRPLVRPPQGATSVKSLAQCIRAGYTTALWSLDSDDCRSESPSEVASRVGQARDGDIILLHEGQKWTLDALPPMVEQLRASGLTPVTVSELLGA
jgi:peptidoglycan/xylan/chitin deacetylase (PgdA/CDA1 family)